MRDRSEILARVAAEVARAAGALIRERAAAPRKIGTKASRVDLVTDTDRAAEALILDRLRTRFPDHAALGEEAGFVPPADGTDGGPVCWMIDPLDGTTNFAHGVPHFAVSIAAVTGDASFAAAPADWRRIHAVAGAVHDPMRDETFVAWQGGPALLDDRPIAVSSEPELDRCLLATGFPYDRREHAERYLAPWRELLVRARDVRRMGAAALDLAWVACGRMDAFWESRLQPWDVAAGGLLVRCAGGTVTDFAGADPGLDARQTLASNGHVHASLVAILEREVPR